MLVVWDLDVGYSAQAFKFENWRCKCRSMVSFVKGSWCGERPLETIGDENCPVGDALLCGKPGWNLQCLLVAVTYHKMSWHGRRRRGGYADSVVAAQIRTVKLRPSLTLSAKEHKSPTTSAKSKFPEVNGNHDIWVCGSPGCGDENDNFGIGQMQWHGDNLD